MPGKPQQNAHIERYNKAARFDWLAHYLFETATDVQAYATKWLWSYSHERPNTAIGGIPPKLDAISAKIDRASFDRFVDAYEEGSEIQKLRWKKEADEADDADEKKQRARPQ